VAVWWISYSVKGVQRKESSHSTNRADAVRLLKKRIKEEKPAAAARLKFSDLVELVRNDYIANERRSLRRVEQALAHLRAFFGNDRKADAIDSAAVNGISRTAQRAA
jgi:hypothetical protein